MSPLVTLFHLAQATVPTTQAEIPGIAKMIKDFFPFIAIIIFLYFFMFRSKKKQDQKVKSMLESLKKGDRVQTIGGIIGTVWEARETEVVLKIDETTNTKMRFARKAIAHVFSDDVKEEKK